LTRDVQSQSSFESSPTLALATQESTPNIRPFFTYLVSSQLISHIRACEMIMQTCPKVLKTDRGGIELTEGLTYTVHARTEASGATSINLPVTHPSILSTPNIKAGRVIS
jgi:hypothetical protein